MLDRIHDKIKYELNYNDDEEREYYTDRYGDVSTLPRDSRNNYIPHNLNMQISAHHRMFWYKIDLEEYFAEDIPVLESKELDLTKD